MGGFRIISLHIYSQVSCVRLTSRHSFEFSFIGFLSRGMTKLLFFQFGTLRFSALQLPNLEYLVLQLTRIVNANQFFNAVVGLPALRSLTLKMKGNTFSEPPHWRGKDRQLYDSLMSMAQRGIIEVSNVDWVFEIFLGFLRLLGSVKF